jgi:mannose-6-phosphate isomerase-like protein (cupin superfamily)
VMPEIKTQILAPGAGFGLRVKVFDTPSFDGQISGTPHVHLVSRELYFVLAGEGAVEVIDAGGYSRFELRPHSMLVFTPGTIHRLLNPNRNLELLVIEQAGLPEWGDSLACFPSEWMESDETFRAAMLASTLEEAYLRRDLAVRGFLGLKQAFSNGPECGRDELSQFYRLAAERSRQSRQRWRYVLDATLIAEAETTEQRIAALSRGELDHLMNASQALFNAREYSGLGCCGRLDRFYRKEELMPDGIAAAAYHS